MPNKSSESEKKRKRAERFSRPAVSAEEAENDESAPNALESPSNIVKNYINIIYVVLLTRFDNSHKRGRLTSSAHFPCPGSNLTASRFRPLPSTAM